MGLSVNSKHKYYRTYYIQSRFGPTFPVALSLVVVVFFNSTIHHYIVAFRIWFRLAPTDGGSNLGVFIRFCLEV